MHLRKDTAVNLIKIVQCLQQAGGWLWVREIGRRTGLHHKTVGRLIDAHLAMFVESQTMEPFKLRMVRLKEDANMDKIARFISVQEKLAGK